jgi:2-polyprenyl-6-methoxyphenol hydroxylase-like FAD-dependent oxidoreductase
MLAARRLGVESKIVDVGSVINKTKTLIPSGDMLHDIDFSLFTQRFGAPSLCVHRADLLRILMDKVLTCDPKAVKTDRQCISLEENDAVVRATFDDGSHERADVLIGADGIHSAVRRLLWGDRKPRYAGYFAWRGIARGASDPLATNQGLFTVGRGVQAGCFHCGKGQIYWFITRNAPEHSRPGPAGDKADILALIENWQTPLVQIVAATEAHAILRNDIIDLPPDTNWGKGRITLVGDAIHATTPNLGQGACQAMEDAVFLAHSLSTVASCDVALRQYESGRFQRTKFVTDQSWQLGRILQLSNPVGVFLRDTLSRTASAKSHSIELFERLLKVELPQLDTTDDF